MQFYMLQAEGNAITTKKKKQFKETYKNIFNKRNAALTEELLKIHLSQRLQSLTKTLI